MRADSRLTGFSQKTALPAFTARSMRSAWVSVGVQMATAAIALSSMIASIVATLAPVAAASASAALASASAIAASVARGLSAMLRPWIWPIRPAPRSAIVSMSCELP